MNTRISNKGDFQVQLAFNLIPLIAGQTIPFIDSNHDGTTGFMNKTNQEYSEYAVVGGYPVDLKYYPAYVGKC